MDFQKETSTVAEQAKVQLADMKSVNNMDIINWLNRASLEAKISEVENALDTYNRKISEANSAKNLLHVKQKELLELTQRFFPSAL
jgi:hypothetical protein